MNNVLITQAYKTIYIIKTTYILFCYLLEKKPLIEYFKAWKVVRPSFA